jgi:hypothetical protein
VVSQRIRFGCELSMGPPRLRRFIPSSIDVVNPWAPIFQTEPLTFHIFASYESYVYLKISSNIIVILSSETMLTIWSYTILRYLKYVLTLSDLIPYSPSVCRSGGGPMEDMNYSSSYERISWRPVPTTSSWGGEKTWISWTADRTQDPLPKRGSVNEHVLMIC